MSACACMVVAVAVVSCFEPFCMSTKTLDNCVKQQSMFSEAVFVLEQHERHVVAWLKPPCETSKARAMMRCHKGIS